MDLNARDCPLNLKHLKIKKKEGNSNVEGSSSIEVAGGLHNV
jgi:hypothetical protein